MGISQLDNPVRVTWDLSGDHYRMAESVVDTVLQRLLDARPFFVALEQSPLLHPACGNILGSLSERGVQLTLFCTGREDELDNISVVNGYDPTILLRLEPFLSGKPDLERLEHVVGRLRDAGHNPGFCLTPLKSNIRFLPILLDFAKGLEIPCFKLPNVRIDANFQQAGEAEILRPEDLSEIKRLLPDMSASIEAINLEIHDLFLWELLAPGSKESRSEYGGCQAANSLAHINHDASVFPCVSWPRSLGSLLGQSFADIWASDACRQVRQSIAAAPAGCSGCRDYQVCFGGCRGLSDTYDTEGGLDPMCNGPR